MNKTLKIILFAVLGFFGVLILGFVGLFVYCWFDDTPIEPTPTPTIKNELNIPDINHVSEEGNKVVYESDDLKLVIESAGEKNLPVAGSSRDGKEWKQDGNSIVVGNKKATVEKNTNNKDKGKIAAVLSALDSKKGYTKGVDDYNHNYAVYYVEAAKCMLYYPKQLTLVKENEDQSLIFRDSRSNAELKVILDENAFASMDEVESLIANSTYSKVLASGTDWFSAENSGKSTTTFCLTGLGNKYAVSAELTYENKYSFVFEELRKLIKCQFIGDGVWVSNAKADTAGKKVAAVADTAYDPVLKRTSYHSEKLNCVIAYPDIFTKCYENNGSEYFTDPKTGAYIELSREKTDLTIGEFQTALKVKESDLVSDHSLRASNNNEIMFASIHDGYIWTAIMVYPAEYSGIYSAAYEMLEICIEGDDVNNTEMKQIYFPAFNCYVIVPVQYKEYGMDGDIHLLKDTITGLEARLSFTKISNPSDYDNLYSVFNVVAEDGNVLLGEDYVKWHNQDGLFLGSAGREYAALLELSYPNAYTTYKNCWSEFGIYFLTGEELETDAEQIRKEAMAAVVLETAKEEIIKENDTETEIYAKADATASKKESNVAERLEKAGKKQGNSAGSSSDSKPEPNRVLVYKTLNDYMDVVTSGDEWLNVFPEIFPRPVDTRQARYYVVLFSMNVLAYNGYTLPDYASDAYAVAEVVDEYVNALSLSSIRINSQLGEGEISVFEVLCYYLGIEDVPQYVLPDSTEEKELLKELPFAEVSKLEDNQSIYGSITCLSFELNDTSRNELKKAIEELAELGFVCEYEDISEWGSEYEFKGTLPGTETEMLISIDMYSESATVLYLLNDGYYTKEAGMLAFYDIDYSFDTLTGLRNGLCYFVDGIKQRESGFETQHCYRYTRKKFDITSGVLAPWVQDCFSEDDYRSCDVIEAGSYNSKGEFVLERTYVYLNAEGMTICLDANGNIIN